MIRSIKTLDELTKEVQNRGFVISRTGIYLRLIPKRSLSIEGRRHVATCPVKLILAQNDHHSKHIDGCFCTATIRSLEELASVLGPKETFFFSQDDKARVNIAINITPNRLGKSDAVGYSGPTYIAIRSGIKIIVFRSDSRNCKK